MSGALALLKRLEDQINHQQTHRLHTTHTTKLSITYFMYCYVKVGTVLFVSDYTGGRGKIHYGGRPSRVAPTGARGSNIQEWNLP